jgi:ABC-type amino acid transport substrate-binding protein
VWFGLSQQCDFLVHEVALTPRRLKMSDYTLPWAYDQFAFLIPIADESANINAVVKPFQWPVGIIEFVF